MSGKPPKCGLCGKFEPREWCWDGLLLDCPLSYPPRHLSKVDLWRMVVNLTRRVDALEQEGTK